MAAKYAYWIKSGKYSMMQKLAVLVFGLLGFMMLARLFTPQELGVWGLFLIISGIVETSRNAFIRNGYILFSNTYAEDQQPAIRFAALLTNIIFTVFMILLFMLCAGAIESLLNAPWLATILYYYCITLLVLVPFSQVEIFLTARMDFRAIFWMYIARNGIFFLAIAGYFISGYELSLPTLSLIFTACAVLGTVAGAFFFREVASLKNTWNKTVFLKFVHYGKFIWGNNICSLVFRNTDSFLTAYYISAAASAFYSSCTRITNFADMPSQVLGDLMFPKAAQVMKQGNMEEIKGLFEKTVAATLTFTLPVVAIVLLFPKWILLVIAGSQYVAAAPILQIIILYGLFLPFIRQFGNIMDVTGRPKVNFAVLAVFAVLNIGFNALGIYIWGLPGSAYGTLFSYFLLFLTTYTVMVKIVHISLVRIVKNIFMLYGNYFRMIRNLFLKTSYAK